MEESFNMYRLELELLRVRNSVNENEDEDEYDEGKFDREFGVTLGYFFFIFTIWQVQADVIRYSSCSNNNRNDRF